jgi:low temperature requirement protein LtrA
VSLASATPQTPRLLRDRSGVQRVTNIELGGHFAERCQGFILIALGESIVIIGATLTEKPVAASDRLPGVHPPA